MSFKNLADGWSVGGRNILAPHNLKILRDCLENGPVILEHRFYYRGRSPDRRVFDDFEDLELYLNEQAAPGDAFWVWDYEALCRNDNFLVMGKKPDEEGRVPETGAY